MITQATTTKKQDTRDDSPGLGGAPYPNHSPLLTAFDKLATAFTRWAATPLAFFLAVLSVAIWIATGPVFQFSENWKLAINIGTAIVTFFMVFLLQQSQNKDSVAMHLKLNELLAANHHASNRMIGIEELSEQHLQDVASFYAKLAERSRTDGAGKRIHSIDEQGMPSTADNAKPTPVTTP